MKYLNKIANAVYKITGVWMVLTGISEIVVKRPVDPAVYGFCLCVLGWIAFNMKATIGGGNDDSSGS